MYVEHGAVARCRRNITCGGVGAVVGTDMARMGGDKGGKGLLNGM